MNEPRVPAHPRRLFLAVAAGAIAQVWLGAARARAASPAESVIRQLVDRALTILRDESLKAKVEERLRRLREAVDAAFDWEKMAKSSLGHHYQKLSEAQRKEFVSIFQELLARQYRNDLDRFRGNERVEFKGTREQGPLRLVQTVLVTDSGDAVPIEYTLYEAAAGWKVEDFAVEGVSLVNHYRRSFDQFLVNGDVEALLERLRRKLGRK